MNDARTKAERVMPELQSWVFPWTPEQSTKAHDLIRDLLAECPAPEWCDSCGGPYDNDRDGGHWDTCPNRFERPTPTPADREGFAWFLVDGPLAAVAKEYGQASMLDVADAILAEFDVRHR